MSKIASVVAVGSAFALLVTGCKGEPGSWETEARTEEKKEKKSTVRVVKTPVAPGTKVPCDKVLDPVRVGEALGQEVLIKDVSESDAEANAVCRVVLAGEPPSAKEQEKKWMENNRVLGVLPGDEICQVTLYCSFPVDVEDKRKRCESEGKQVGEAVGRLTCTRIVHAGAEDRYIYEVIDGDPECTYLINPGPSVVGPEVPEKCARMAVDQIGPENVKVN